MAFKVTETAVSSLFSSLTAVSVLAHALLGCCWHHAHACEDAVSHGEAADLLGGHCHAPAVSASCGCGHHSCQGDSEGPDPCHGGRCTFLRSERARAPAEAPMPCPFPGTCAMIDATASSRLAGGEHKPSCSADGLPLRLHLFYQILLI